MTRATVSRDGTRFRLECRGHAGFAASGKDVVCAAVSAICQTLLLWCRNTDTAAVRRAEMEPGHFLLEAEGEDCAEPWKAAALGLMSLQQGYPGHVQVRTDIFD